MRSIIALPNDYVVVDIETTGLSSTENEIIEIAAIRYRNGAETERFSQLVGTDSTLPLFISGLTGITKSMLAGRPRIHEVIRSFSEFIGDDILIGHNIASFDSSFINQAYMQHLGKELSNSCVDTIRLFRKLYPDARIRSLEWLAEHYDVPYENAHRGASDCEITHACYQAIRKEILAVHSEAEFIQSCDKRAPKRKVSEIKPTGEITSANPLYQKTIVFTGSLSMTRADAMQIAADAGAILKTSVSKNTDFLVVGGQDITRVGTDGMSSKEEKAYALNDSGKAQIKIISEADFLAMAKKQ